VKFEENPITVDNGAQIAENNDGTYTLNCTYEVG
jgi:hypothetical protein